MRELLTTARERVDVLQLVDDSTARAAMCAGSTDEEHKVRVNSRNGYVLFLYLDVEPKAQCRFDALRVIGSTRSAGQGNRKQMAARWRHESNTQANRHVRRLSKRQDRNPKTASTIEY